MKNLQISLEVFEGPFDLLFKLIDKNKINIYDIPISELTEQYIKSINKMSHKNMEETSQFILMASTLLQIKSKMLLPKQEKEVEEDPREELVQKLLEYKKIKKISELLKERFLEAGESVFKTEDEKLIKELVETKQSTKDTLQGVSLEMLYEVFQDTLKRKELKVDKIRSNFNSVTKAMYNIKDKIQYVKDLLTLNKTVNINSLFEQSSCKSEIIVTFLAVLEIVKEKYIIVKQDDIFSNIVLTRSE